METISEARKRNSAVLWIVLIALLLLAMTTSLLAGRYAIPFSNIVEIIRNRLAGLPPADKDANVFLNIRVPRVLLNVLVGGGLAIAGASFQGVFQNPLVSPDVLSVSSGSAFGAVLGIMIYGSPAVNTALALCFGMVSLFLTYGLSRLRGNRSVLNLILAGMIMTALFNALISFMKYIADTETQLPEITYWLMGSFANTSYREIKIVILPITIGAVVLLLLRHRINILSLGDEEAIALGVDPGKTRFLILLMATLVTASCVTVTGIIGWVGLVIPHISRMLVGVNHDRSLGVSLIIGGIFMTLVDTISRTLVAAEIPIGILTALIGAPFFAYVFWRMGSNE